MDQTKPVAGRRRSMAVLATTCIALLLAMVPAPAGAHRVDRWWQYDKSFWRHEAQDHRSFNREHGRWHQRRHSYRRAHHRRFHHHDILHDHRRTHFNPVVEKQSGEASHYNHSRGACGQPLVGRYAAHPSWPCGTRVSVKHGDRYVIVRILDRGPYAHGRVIDLSEKAFAQLAPLGAGVIDVDIFRLGRRR